MNVRTIWHSNIRKVLMNIETWVQKNAFKMVSLDFGDLIETQIIYACCKKLLVKVSLSLRPYLYNICSR